MALEDTIGVLTWVIDVLLPLGDKKSLDDQLQEAVAREAAEVAVRRVGGGVKTEDGNYPAIITIVARTNIQAVADHAVNACLRIYDNSKKEFFHLRSNDALDAATRMLAYVSVPLKEKVIKAVAKNGWYGRIEALARNYLNRRLTVDEVMTLVDEYVNDKGSRSEHQEKVLIRMVQTYAPEKVDEVKGKIDWFVKAFQEDDLY